MEGQMRTTRFSRYMFILPGCLLVFLLAACGSTGVNPPPGGSTATAPANSTQTPSPGSGSTSTTVTTAPVPPTQIGCPATNVVRVAITAPLALGKDANVVYLVTEFGANASSTSTLKRVDVATGAKAE